MIRLIGVMLTLTLGAAAIGLWLHTGSSGAAEAATSIPDGAPAIAGTSHSAAPAPISPPDDVTPPDDITPPTPRQPPLVFPDDGDEGLGEPVCGGTYEGEIVGGGTILIVVADDCETIASVEIANFAEDCGALPAELTFDPPLAVEDSMFFGWATTNSGPTVLLGGTFLEDGTIFGSIIVTLVRGCLIQETFVAELVVAPDVEELPATGGSFIAADGGVSPGVWVLIGALVAAGATGMAVFGWRHARIQ